MSTASEEGDADFINFDKVLSKVGGFGTYHKFFFFLLCLPAIFTAFLSFESVFLASVPDHRCRIAICDAQNAKYQDAFTKKFANFTIPRTAKRASGYSECSCLRPKREQGECKPANFLQNKTVSCDTWIYDETIHGSTIVSEWDIVCSEAWKAPLTQSVFFSGTLISAPLFGVIADRFGRRQTLMVALLLTLLTGLLLSFSPSCSFFLSFQLLVSIFQLGVFQTAFILAVELVGKKYRVFCGIAIEFFFVMGELYLAGMAYFIMEWRKIVLAGVCPIAGFLLYWPFIPESVRWLNSKGKKKEAEDEIKRLIEWNLRNADVTCSVDEFKERSRSNHQTQPTNQITTFLRNKTLVVRLVNVSYCWFVVSLVFYGLSLNASTLVPGNQYLNFFLVSLVEIPGYALSYITMENWGRRRSVVLGLFVGGIACLVDGGLTKFGPGLEWINVSTFLVGKLGVTAAFATIYLYSSELLPTPVRTAALGFSSMMARIGAISATYVAMLEALSGPWLPLFVFGINSILSGFLILLLPETRGRELPQTNDEAVRLADVPTSVGIMVEEAENDNQNFVNNDDDLASENTPLISNFDILR